MDGLEQKSCFDCIRHLKQLQVQWMDVWDLKRCFHSGCHSMLVDFDSMEFVML